MEDIRGGVGAGRTRGDRRAVKGCRREESDGEEGNEIVRGVVTKDGRGGREGNLERGV